MEQAKGHTVQKGQTAAGISTPATEPTAAVEAPIATAAAEVKMDSRLRVPMSEGIQTAMSAALAGAGLF